MAAKTVAFNSCTHDCATRFCSLLTVAQLGAPCRKVEGPFISAPELTCRIDAVHRVNYCCAGQNQNTGVVVMSSVPFAVTM